MMQLITENSELHYLLLIGAYRDNEVKDYHPLTKLIKCVQEKPQYDEITLEPLEEEHIQSLIFNTFKSQALEWKSLAKLIYQKTQV